MNTIHYKHVTKTQHDITAMTENPETSDINNTHHLHLALRKGTYHNFLI